MRKRKSNHIISYALFLVVIGYFVLNVHFVAHTIDTFAFLKDATLETTTIENVFNYQYHRRNPHSYDFFLPRYDFDLTLSFNYGEDKVMVDYKNVKTYQSEDYFYLQQNINVYTNSDYSDIMFEQDIQSFKLYSFLYYIVIPFILLIFIMCKFFHKKKKLNYVFPEQTNQNMNEMKQLLNILTNENISKDSIEYQQAEIRMQELARQKTNDYF